MVYKLNINFFLTISWVNKMYEYFNNSKYTITTFMTGLLKIKYKLNAFYSH